MATKVNIAIIGAGTAGLSAYKEASKYTKDILVIDRGPIGSTCARVGCMPSKLLIHVANEFYKRKHFAGLGIKGADKLNINISEALQYVRTMRDRFTNGVIETTQSIGNRFIDGEAKFVSPNTLEVNKNQIIAKKVIIATGSSSILPEEWLKYESRILTSDNIFEQVDFSNNIAVVGGGVIGLELGQALSRLGVNITLYHSHHFIGGLTDPKVNETAIKVLGREFTIQLGERVELKEAKNDSLAIIFSGKENEISQVLVATGRRPNVDTLNLQCLDIKLDEYGIPLYDNTTMQIADFPIYIAGDANKKRPLLHEAADEGRIAGFNAANSHKQCFIRRVPIYILFSQPNIAIAGKRFNELSTDDFVVGEVDYSDQGRAKIEKLNNGILRIYCCKKTGELLGSECITPAGEHLAHMIAWAIQQKLTVFDVLQMPFYHPVIEEGMRTALRDAARQVAADSKPSELAMCDSEAIHSLA